MDHSFCDAFLEFEDLDNYERYREGSWDKAFLQSSIMFTEEYTAGGSQRQMSRSSITTKDIQYQHASTANRMLN